MPRKLVAQQGGLGTGKMVCLGNLWLSKVVYAQGRWCAYETCGSASGLGKDGVPRKLVPQQGGLGTGKMVCLGNLWLSKVV